MSHLGDVGQAGGFAQGEEGGQLSEDASEQPLKSHQHFLPGNEYSNNKAAGGASGNRFIDSEEKKDYPKSHLGRDRPSAIQREPVVHVLEEEDKATGSPVLARAHECGHLPQGQVVICVWININLPKNLHPELCSPAP